MRASPLLTGILTALVASGCSLIGPKGEWTETSLCMDVEDDAESCPAADDVDEDSLWSSGWCSTDVDSINGEGEVQENPWSYYSDTASTEAPDLVCCYPATARDAEPNCAIGRPLMQAGAPRLASLRSGSGWSVAEGSPEPERAQRWLRAALAEHASVAAFARLTLDLMALGAPADILAQVQQAASDEVEHARLCFGLASRFAGRAIEPGPMQLSAAPVCSDLGQVAVAAVREGCLGETIGAFLAQQAADQAQDPQEKAVLQRVADDEARHAALSWRIVAWLVQQGGEPVRAQVAAAFMKPFAVHPGMGPASAESCEQVRREVLEPAARVLLAA